MHACLFFDTDVTVGKKSRPHPIGLQLQRFEFVGTGRVHLARGIGG